jgi:DNA-binding NarL/FixJ family response regulator
MREHNSEPLSSVTRLTPREREAVVLLTVGLSNREIAARLSITEKTVECHLVSAFRKYGVHSRTALVATMATHPASRPLPEGSGISPIDDATSGW